MLPYETLTPSVHKVVIWQNFQNPTETIMGTNILFTHRNSYNVIAVCINLL